MFCSGILEDQSNPQPEHAEVREGAACILGIEQCLALERAGLPSWRPCPQYPKASQALSFGKRHEC